MKTMPSDQAPFLEPERYELHESGFSSKLSRRRFFKLVGSGLVVAFVLPRLVQAQAPGSRRRRGFGGNLAPQLSAWLHIDKDGITVYTGKTEIGQNIRTSLTQVVAEELRTPPGQIRLVMADTALTPYDMGTFGSMTTPMMASQLRRAAATARDMLIDLAAERGKAPKESFQLADGKVTSAQANLSFSFGQLTEGKKLLGVVSDKAATTPPERWVIEGTSLPKVDGHAFVTGAHIYASDVKRPDMVFGKLLRPSHWKAKLTSVDTHQAEALPGVAVVHEGDFIGVTAPSEEQASQALAAIHAEWSHKEQPSAAELFHYLKDHPAEGRGFRFGFSEPRGSIKDGLASAAKTLQTSYTVAYIAHVPLEPRAAVAEWSDGKLTVWTGTQRPFGVRDELVGAFDLKPEQVRVIVPDMGSGYGGKHTGEAAVEAARLAKAVKKPVKLVWTREEEFTWGYFRPAGIIDINAGVKADGTLTAWEAQNYNSGASALDTPYRVANKHVNFQPTVSPLRQGSYRGLAATANTFARETHMDALAHAIGMEPLAFRMHNLEAERLKGVLQAAADRFGWGKQPPAPGHGFGIAAGTEKGSYVSTCAEVQADPESGQVKVLRLVTAFDCGAVLNPDHLKNQIEGAIMMGIGGALYEEVRFADGQMQNASMAKYRVPRFQDMPALDVVLVDRKDLPSAGAGETPIIAVAPAIGNAIFQATGVRLTAMPLAPRGLKKSEAAAGHASR